MFGYIFNKLFRGKDMAKIIDGKKLSIELQDQLKDRLKEFKKVFNITPCIAVILAGDDPASAVYVGSKEKMAKSIGYRSIVIKLGNEVTTSQVILEVEKLNRDDSVHGILVQLPLPKTADESIVLRAIDPKKDVDGFHPYNVGMLNIGADCLMPCTPRGIMTIFEEYCVDVKGKNVVVLGRSNIVGKPIAAMLTKAHATVTICHSKTENLQEICSRADIIIAAIGKPKFVTAEYIKEGAIVIDVGINRVDGKLCGDVDFENVKDKCGLITPVPGGVGPMTIVSLMENTFKACQLVNRKLISQNFDKWIP